MTNTIRLVIADDHPVVRDGLCFSINQEPRIQVVGQAGDGETALALVQQHLPDIAVLDIEMPKLNGLAVAREIERLCLKTRIIFLTLHKDEDLFLAAMDAGGSGYLLKDSVTQEIVAGVLTVAAGRLYVSSAMTTQMLENRSPFPQLRDATTASLTPTERRILALIADGNSSKEIGEKLKIHYRTVENHRTNICRKLRLEGANALVRFALQQKALISKPVWIRGKS